MAFDFKKSLIKVQGGRTYLPVSARLIWFREEHPDWGIESEAIAIDTEKQYAIFRARIYNGEGKLMATGTKMEDVKGFPDYLEKAETGAVGRALALCGYGTQFSPELDEVKAGRFADSPQPSGGNRYGSNPSGGGGYNGGRNESGRDDGGRNDNGGSRFAPPREVSAPRETPPPPAPARPAPVKDDFEDVIEHGAPDMEDDPFDGGSIRESAPAAKSAAPAPAVAAPASGPPECAGCGKALTKAQHDLSVRNYGQALCPSCQKDKSRTDRPAVAAR